MSMTLAQIYASNPITSNASTDLMYFSQSPYSAGHDAAMTFASFAEQFLLAGSNPWAKGDGTLSALGGGANSAIGANSLSWGQGARAGGINAISIGNANTANGDNSLALQGGTASNTSSVAIQGTASGVGAFALGLGSAGGDYSYALGKNASANFAGSYVWGDSQNNNASDSAQDQYVVNCNGGFLVYVKTAVAAALAFNVDANGNSINVQGVADQSYSRQVPTTGFSITIAAGVKTLVLVPASQLATGTITMPASPIDGQIIDVACEAAGVTALTVDANSGQTIGDAPTSISPGGGFRYQYDLANTNWMPIFQNLASSGGASPWTAGAGTDSAYGGGAIDGGANFSLTWGTSSSVGLGANYGISLGYNSAVTQVGGISIGNSNSSSAVGAIAIGAGCTSNANTSVAIGFHSNCYTSATGAVAIGYECEAHGAQSFVCGSGAQSSFANSFIFNDGNTFALGDTAAGQAVFGAAGGLYHWVNTATTPSIAFQSTKDGCMLIGTNTNDSAATGYVGEFISSIVTFASAISLTTSTDANVTSISLSAGDWDVWGNVWFSATGGAMTAEVCWSSETSASMPDQSLTTGYDLTTAANGINIPYNRYSVATTTTIYLSCAATFAAGSAKACGGIYARRAR